MLGNQDAVVTNETLPPSATRSRRGLWALLLLLALLGLAGWRSWVSWQARESRTVAEAESTAQRVAALEKRLETLRGDQRAQTQRIQDAAATNRVLRDEVLGLSQRGALLEESVSKLADPTRHGAQALRLDEVELLLSQAQQRLEVARDLEGARRAYALAAGALQGVDDPRLLNLGQALAQERASLEALGAGPQAAIVQQLDGFSAALATLPQRVAAQLARPTWQRVLAPLVDVRPTVDEVLIAPSQRAAGEAALQIELALARAAVERGDSDGYRRALARAAAWLPQLWPDSPALRQQSKQLRQLQAMPLRSELPVLGSTLQQLRLIRGADNAPPSPPAVPLTVPTAQVQP